MTIGYDDLPASVRSELGSIYPPDPEPFVCAICERHVQTRFPGFVGDWPIAPLCRFCERTWGLAGLGSAGSFRDRRIANQIKALAEVIQAESYRTAHRNGERL